MSKKEGNPKVAQIPKGDLFVGELNARLDPGDLTVLVSSIRDNGIIEPLVVRPTALEGKYEIIAGRRRFEAGKKAGLDKYPCVVRQVADVEALVISLDENMARQSMTIEEEGSQYKKLYERLRSWSEVAKETGQSEQRIRGAYNAYDAYVKTGQLVKKFAPWQAQDALSKTQATQVGRIINANDVRRKLNRLTEERRNEVYAKLGDAVFRVGPKKTWKLLEDFKKDPLQDLSTLAERVEKEPQPLKLSVYFNAKTGPFIIAEADRRHIAPSQLVTEVVEEYLAQRGYQVAVAE